MKFFTFCEITRILSPISRACLMPPVARTSPLSFTPGTSTIPDCLDQANQIADISCFIRETHIDNGALIRKTIEFSVYFHAAFSEFLPEIPGKNNICSSVFRRFMNDTVKFICIMVI